MIPADLTGFHHYLEPENPFQIPPDFGMLQTDYIPNFHLNRLLLSSHEFTSQSSSISNNSSTSDEAEEQQLRIIDERKQRRMISNRESARRSRMRKQKQLDELWSQVVRLRMENHNLVDKLTHVSECHDRVIQENARLKEETSDLRQMLTGLQIGSPYTNAAFRDLEEVPDILRIRIRFQWHQREKPHG